MVQFLCLKMMLFKGQREGVKQEKCKLKCMLINAIQGKKSLNYI